MKKEKMEDLKLMNIVSGLMIFSILLMIGMFGYIVITEKIEGGKECIIECESLDLEPFKYHKGYISEECWCKDPLAKETKRIY